MDKKNKPTEDNIHKIIAWFDVFDRVLTKEEVVSGQWLVVSKSNSTSKKLWNKINFWTKIFKKIPFIKMIAVCNTLAFGCPDENSDIDLFIVTDKNRLFIARTLITLVTQICGIRRHGNKIKGRFCLSFFITENALDFTNIQIPNGDPYLAFWAVTLKPLFGQETYEKFLKTNQNWINRTIPFCHPPSCHSHENGNPVNESLSCHPRECGDPVNTSLNCHPRECGDPVKYSSSWDQLTPSLLTKAFSFFLNFLESLLASWQIKRCKLKLANLDSRSSIIISKDILKFHNVDMRGFYKKEWEKRLIKYK